MSNFLNLYVAISLFAIRLISSYNLIILWLFLEISFLLCLIYGMHSLWWFPVLLLWNSRDTRPPSQLINLAHILINGWECWRFSNKEIPTKLNDTLEKVKELENKSNSELWIEYYEYLRSVRTSERSQSGYAKGSCKVLRIYLWLPSYM